MLVLFFIVKIKEYSHRIQISNNGVCDIGLIVLLSSILIGGYCDWVVIYRSPGWGNKNDRSELAFLGVGNLIESS